MYRSALIVWLTQVSTVSRKLLTMSDSPTPTGFVWQAVMTGAAPGGRLEAHTCMVVTLSPAGKVARTDEYVDSAQLRPLSTRVTGERTF